MNKSNNTFLIACAVFAAIATLLMLVWPRPSSAQTLPPVQITQVIADTDSAKIDFAAVPGAVDYRVYNVTTPNDVKYAGQIPVASGSGMVNQPVLEIEENGLTPGVPVQLVVQAVNELGPVPQGNLMNGNNAPLYPDSFMPGMSMLGSDMGETLDGNTSTNGQGPYTDNPQVIAQSAPFTVTATGLAPLPSGSDSSQVLYDDFLNDTSPSFPQGNITTITSNPNTDTAQYELKTQLATWNIFGNNIDVTDTKPFIANNHYMDVLFDDGTPGSNNPLHVGHGVLAMSPQQTVNFANGQILHMTMEVDGEFAGDSRRWCAFNVAPANDPITNFDFGFSNTSMINNSNDGFFVQFNPNLQVDTYGMSGGNATDNRIVGAAGQATYNGSRLNNANGLGLDDRSRFDLFVSQTHFQVYEDGVKISDYDIPGGLPFSNAVVYFSHYVYHTSLFLQETAQYYPFETFWLNYMQYSDERHWNNMGFEVLPASDGWSAIQSHIVGMYGGTATAVAGGSGSTTGTGTGTTGTGAGATGTGTTGTGSGTTGTGTTGTGSGTGTNPPPAAATSVTGKITAITATSGSGIAITIKSVSLTTTDPNCIAVAADACFTGTKVAATYSGSTLASISATP